MNETIGEETAENRKWFERGRQSALEEVKGVVEGERQSYRTMKRATPFQDTLSNYAVNVLTSTTESICALINKP